MGTAPYMSPEQVRGEKLDARTDLFSFGLVLYEMAVGRVAFAGDTVAEVHDAILNRIPRPLREANPAIPPKMEAFIGKALEKDRELRYQTAAEMRADLREVGAGLVPPALLRAEAETHSQEPDVREERGELLRRWRLWLAGTLAVILAGLAVVWSVSRHAAKRPEVAERQLTANPSEDWLTGAAISPDGRYVAYVDQTGLYLRSIDSGETHAVVVPSELRSRIWQIRWHPGGAELLLTVFDAEDSDLWIVTVLGEAPPHLLYRNGLEPAISPDGRMIAFVRTDPAVPPTVWVAGIGGEAPGSSQESSNRWLVPGWVVPPGRPTAGGSRTSIGQKVLKAPGVLRSRSDLPQAGPRRLSSLNRAYPNRVRCVT
jgi:hypothetical protein